ncbi:hypothetical protein J1605_006863 [Eschrichtius robustus]|uniref:Uncharacterized protein n=1 Tax=Eschrichtius robustus TaxID=9764 RepID=A0AB34H2B8_ESCRO|nr:hypothetical protein J1605_006863 [Eschrichtius robustus]
MAEPRQRRLQPSPPPQAPPAAGPVLVSRGLPSGVWGAPSGLTELVSRGHEHRFRRLQERRLADPGFIWTGHTQAGKGSGAQVPEHRGDADRWALAPPSAPARGSLPPAVYRRFIAARAALSHGVGGDRARSSLSSESSPVSSPATNHSSPASTPKRVPMGPIIVPPGGHSVPSTPPVVTIAPTKTVNGVWRSESRQQLPIQTQEPPKRPPPGHSGALALGPFPPSSALLPGRGVLTASETPSNP